MRTPILVTAIACLLLVAAANVARAPVQAQDADGTLVNNPDLLLPRQRVENNVQFSLREARNREMEARRFEREGKGEQALDRWRDALARYEALRREHLRPDMPRNSELLVRVEWLPNQTGKRSSASNLNSETYQPLADYINSRFRAPDWPRPLREQLAMRQATAGADLLARAITDNDELALRQCARFYQFSEPGRRALRLLAELALERGDAVTAVRWLDELQGSWRDQFERDASLQVLYARACREADMRYRLGHELIRRERAGSGGSVDIGGRRLESAEAVTELASSTAPMERPELRQPGWLTAHGNGARNGIAPPVQGIGAMVDLDPAEGVQGRRLAATIPGLDEKREPYTNQVRRAVPVPYPVAHQSGLFVHRIDEAQGNDEKILWFRHGRESSPVSLEVPRGERYTARQSQVNHWYSSQEMPRMRYRIMGSSIGRLRWELDNRESDVLFAVMGTGSPSREASSEPTGNQIQAWDLTDDAKLRVTLPNRKIESEEEIGFLRHVVFSGAPLIRGNNLYVAGAFMEKDSVEIWLFCFDVTPKGDSAQGEGKLQWRVHLCSQRQQSQPWRYTPVTLPEISSPSEQGGVIYISTHAGATAAVDRVTGELCWVSRYGRVHPPISQGWFPGPPVAASGMVVAAPYDYDLALMLDSVWGINWFGYPLFRMGPSNEFEHVLGVVDNCVILQGRTRLYSVSLTDYVKEGEHSKADWGSLNYQSAEFAKDTIGSGVIAGDRVLVPFDNEIAFYDVRSGKLLTRSPLTGVAPDKAPFTLTVYCRGEPYQDEHDVTRYKPASVTDPDTGSAYSVEHLRNGDEFTFPSGKSAKVFKETFVVLASARWMYVFEAHDGGETVAPAQEKPADGTGEEAEQENNYDNKEEGQE